MRSTKDQLVKKDVLMPVKNNVFLWNLPDVEEVPLHMMEKLSNSPLVSMEIPLRTAYGQNGRYGMQPKASSLRAQAQLKSRTETCEIVEEKPKPWTLEKRRTREVREQALPSEYHRQTYL
ncbi:hypothetical protein TNCV_1952901 [Trichonephila clavipes]|nr:hypothetical protein TNCV_1952901 [Trichonephila clavipes]